MKKLIQAKEWLKARWGIESDARFWKIFLLFALTGSSAVRVKNAIFHALDWNPDTLGFAFWPVRIIAIFIFYQFLFLAWGWILGEFKFAKWFVGKMTGRFVGKKPKDAPSK